MSTSRGTTEPVIGGRQAIARLQRPLVRLVYRTFIALPYPPRKVATAVFIAATLIGKRLLGVEGNRQPTPPDKLYTLSFWGVPTVDLTSYALAVDGLVDRPQGLSLSELGEMADVERPVTLDCVGGARNNCVMRGVSIRFLLTMAQPRVEATTAVFHCADGYFTSLPLGALLERDAFLAFEVNGQRLPHHGYPLRLAIPGKYGYKWAKWVERIELVASDCKGYWESRGLPHRADIGDIW